MRDIVLKNHGLEHSLAEPARSKQRARFLKRKGIAGLIENSYEVLLGLGDWVKQKLEPRVFPDIITPSKRIPYPFLDVNPRLNFQEKGRPIHHKIKHAIKRRSKKVGQALKSPIGKLTLVQAALMVIMLVYVSHATKSQPGEAKKQLATSQKVVLRNYLPTAQDYVEPKPFQENAASFEHKDLAFHAWITPWNTEQLMENSPIYSSLSAFWLTVEAGGASFKEKGDWKIWDEFLTKNKRGGQKTFLTVSGNPDDILLVLSNPVLQDQHIQKLLEIVQQHSFSGVDVNYEGLGRENRTNFSYFISKLTEKFHAHGKLVAVTVESRVANQVPMDWRIIGQLADEVRLMIYDYHASQTQQPGPVAPLGWVKEVIEYADQLIETEKLVIGLGNYGYDWVQPEPDIENWQGVGISFDQAVALAKEKAVPIIRVSGIDDRGYDIGSIPTFSYKDEQGKEHSVWFEDEASLRAKVNLVSQYYNRGIIFWSVGLGDKKFWEKASIH